MSSEVAWLEQMVRHFELGGSIQPVNLAFEAWAMQLVFHADQEDPYMTGEMPDFVPAGDNEYEHADLAVIIGGHNECLNATNSPDLSQRVNSAIPALHVEQHNELLTRWEDVMSVLSDEIGRVRYLPPLDGTGTGVLWHCRLPRTSTSNTRKGLSCPKLASGSLKTNNSR